MEAKTDPRGAILDHLPEEERNLFKDIALAPVWRGLTVTEAIVAEMAAEYWRLAVAAARHGAPVAMAVALRGTVVIHNHYDEALAFAGWLLSQPPTARQIADVRSLGWTGEIESRAHASSLIDALKTLGRSR